MTYQLLSSCENVRFSISFFVFVFVFTVFFFGFRLLSFFCFSSFCAKSSKVLRSPKRRRLGERLVGAVRLQ